ncbi:formimidoylglutamase [Gracilimonas sp.]|uniref:formimidoylglutamase n=1 Tax=Gracilimonas sp. TaxID=1974203 RepID=UPI002870B89A|nr:formimidoylglutamase [Gracilimonas sp.]
MGIERIEHLLNPVKDGFRKLRSHDKHDHWLVQEILFENRDYDQATNVLVGCPQHEGVQRNNGRIGAAEAPNKIREQLYKMQIATGEPVKLFDAGNIKTDYYDMSDDIDLMSTQKEDSLDVIHNALTKVVSEFLRNGKKVVVLGGGNDISYADVRALAEVERDISVINIDAHLDMRMAEEMTSGTPYRKAIEDHYLVPHHFYEFGIRRESNGAFYLNNAREQGVNIHLMNELVLKGVESTFHRILRQIGNRPLFLGLDMDSIQASDAPGVSASSPSGLSGREVNQCIHHAKQKENLKVFEITEVNPKYDVDNRTVKLAAQFIFAFLFG